jgi:broad specificity phosphatase PhoE
MKIGLLRHFEVKIHTPKSCDSKEFDRVCLMYDQNDIIPQKIDIPVHDYSLCFSSSMKRAVETAQIVFNGEIIVTEELVEVEMKSLFETNRKWSFTFWKVMSRVGWIFNLKRMPETRKQTEKRAAQFLSKLSGYKDNKDINILLVTHGFFMGCLQQELLKMGFRGKKIISPRCGELYEFIK